MSGRRSAAHSLRARFPSRRLGFPLVPNPCPRAVGLDHTPDRSGLLGASHRECMTALATGPPSPPSAFRGRPDALRRERQPPSTLAATGAKPKERGGPLRPLLTVQSGHLGNATAAAP